MIVKLDSYRRTANSPSSSIVNWFLFPILVTVRYLLTAFGDDMLNQPSWSGNPISHVWKNLYFSEISLYCIVLPSLGNGNARIVFWPNFSLMLILPFMPWLGIWVDFFLPYAQVLSLFTSLPSGVCFHCWARKSLTWKHF